MVFSLQARGSFNTHAPGEPSSGAGVPALIYGSGARLVSARQFKSQSNKLLCPWGVAWRSSTDNADQTPDFDPADPESRASDNGSWGLVAPPCPKRRQLLLRVEMPTDLGVVQPIQVFLGKLDGFHESTVER